MADTSALVELNKVVDDYLLKYKKPFEDAFIYVAHACDCVQRFNLYDNNVVVTEKVTINANKWIEMPDSMLGFNDLLVAVSDGRFWSCTEQSDIVTTTTTTLGVEGRDETIGEGAGITDPKTDTYGGVGGVNDYYYTIDWNARRIYTEGFDTETVVLKYVSSGIEVGGTTYVPSLIIPMIEAYLLWKESYWIAGLARERDMREKDYTKARLEIRSFINSMSYSEWKDLFNSLATQAPQR